MKEEMKPESEYSVGDQVMPMFGNFKDKVGSITKKVWWLVRKEWMYAVHFIDTTLWYYGDELKREGK